MASPAANHVPDEIISEILTPLLTHPEEVFADRSTKALLEPGYSSSTYLVVCKAWLRVSTPLLYNVVILRTTAQAEALRAALKSTKELGLFIKKLRVEGGFGDAMHTILTSAPNITDLFLTLCIWGSDSAQGLCSGLPAINPQCVIVVDAVEYDQKPKKNKQVTQLLETLVDIIPKWDKLQIFDFPYRPLGNGHTTLDARAEALASALRQSHSLETLLVRAGNTFPDYFREMVNVSSFKSLRMTLPESNFLGIISGRLRSAVAEDPKLKAIVTLPNIDRDGTLPPFLPFFLPPLPSSLPPLPKNDNYPPWATDIPTLKTLGETVGATLEDLRVQIFPKMENLRISKAPIPPADPKILEPFRALIRLQWVADAKFSFSAPAPRFSALANLQQLCLLDTKSAAILDLCLQLSLPSLREVHLAHVNAPAAIAFLELHGSKLVQLTATLEVVVKAKIFDLCTRLNTVAVIPSHGKNEDLPEDFIACSTPHSALAEIHIEFYILERRHELPMKRSIEGLKAESFPVLKEVKLSCIKWPTSEREIRKNKWIPLSETLRHKGIKLVDMYGVGGTGTGRNLV